MPIYTKTGDSGETSLYGGKRVSKSHAYVEAYGSVDELNCWVGKIITVLDGTKEKHLHQFLSDIQSDLFVIGGNLAGWKGDVSVLAARIAEMEIEIDTMEEQLPALTNFILPGGSKRAADIHITRSITRRVERTVVGLDSLQGDRLQFIQYFNRLSDLFFVLSRYITMIDSGSEKYWSGL